MTVIRIVIGAFETASQFPSQFELYNTPTASLQMDKTPLPPPNECPADDTKQSDGEVPIMLEL